MANSNYPLDKIIVMTLERTPERYERWIGASAIMQIPSEIVSIAYGNDNLNYHDDMHIVAEAALGDGFPFVEEYTKIGEEHGTQQTAATVCQVWNYCRILRQLAEDQETALIIFDDKMLTIYFQEFCELVSEVQSIENEDFYALQLKMRGGLNEIRLPQISNNQRVTLSHQVFGSIFSRYNDGNFIDVFLQKGISGFDESIVFSPEGAKWMLKCLDMAPDYYRYLDHFICQALPDFAAQAIKRNKGIYCPAEIGYKFVDEFMSVGTTTDYAVKDKSLYNRSIENVEIDRYWKEPEPEPEIEPSIEVTNEDLQSKLENVLTS